MSRRHSASWRGVKKNGSPAIETAGLEPKDENRGWFMTSLRKGEGSMVEAGEGYENWTSRGDDIT